MDTDWQAILFFYAMPAVLLLAAACLFERRAEQRDRRMRPPPGRMVAVGRRHLHFLARGAPTRQGAPTVVIEQGAGEPSRYWWAIQDRVAHFARVCTYDRAGFGWSGEASPGRTIDDRADELHAVLAAAGETGPYVLVAHSYGGFIVRRFAAKFPQATAGLVLVDTPEEAVVFRPAILRFYRRMRVFLRLVQALAGVGVLRLVSRWYNVEAVGLPYVCPREYGAAADDIASLEKVGSEGRVSRPRGSLGDLPLAVVTHGLPFRGPFAFLEEGWREGQQRLAALSSAGELIVAHTSNHMIQLDEPDVIVDAIRRVHARACARSRPAEPV